jgi:chromosome segregation protein
LTALQEHVVSLEAELASSLVSADAKAAADGVIKSLKAQLSAQAAASASAITAQAAKLMSLENLLENRARESEITLKDATEQGKLWQESFAALKESSNEADSQVAALRQQSKEALTATATATATADKQRANFEQREQLLAEVEGLKKKLISIAASGVEARSAVAKDLAEAVEARAWAEKEVAAAEAQAKAARAEIENLKKELASQAPSRARALAEAAEARTWAEKEVAAAKAESKSASEAPAQLLKVTEAKAAAATSNGSSDERSVMEAQVAAKAEKVARLCMTLQSEVQRLKAELASERSRPSLG